MMCNYLDDEDFIVFSKISNSLACSMSFFTMLDDDDEWIIVEKNGIEILSIQTPSGGKVSVYQEKEYRDTFIVIGLKDGKLDSVMFERLVKNEFPDVVFKNKIAKAKLSLGMFDDLDWLEWRVSHLLGEILSSSGHSCYNYNEKETNGKVVADYAWHGLSISIVAREERYFAKFGSLFNQINSKKTVEVGDGIKLAPTDITAVLKAFDTYFGSRNGGSSV
jgi:hypothetical protein